MEREGEEETDGRDNVKYDSFCVFHSMHIVG
jgi:hypothetical protein